MSEDLLKRIADLVGKTIASGEEFLEMFNEDLEEGKEARGFYECGLDYDGVPYAEGHAHDTYDSGFHNGRKSGANDLAVKIKALMDSDT